MLEDGLMHENIVLSAAATQRAATPVLPSNEPSPEHFFEEMSSGNAEEQPKDILRPVSGNTKPSFWDVVRSRSAEAKVLHSFVGQRADSSGMSTPTLEWASTSCETRTRRDVHSDALPANRTMRDLPRWRKAWLREKQRSSTSEGMAASPETPRPKSTFESMADSPKAPRPKSWHEAHRSPSSASSPLRRHASARGLSSPPSRSSFFTSSPEGPPASLTALYHATRAKFPNVLSPTRAACPDPPSPPPLSAAPDSFNRNRIAQPPHHAPAFYTRRSDGPETDPLSSGRRTARSRSSSAPRSASSSRRTSLRASRHPPPPPRPRLRAPTLLSPAGRTALAPRAGPAPRAPRSQESRASRRIRTRATLPHRVAHRATPSRPAPARRSGARPPAPSETRRDPATRTSLLAPPLPGPRRTAARPPAGPLVRWIALPCRMTRVSRVARVVERATGTCRVAPGVSRGGRLFLSEDRCPSPRRSSACVA